MTEDVKRKLLGLLGLARRAGRLAVGFGAVEQMARRGRGVMVIAASDMGGSQKSKVDRFEKLAGLLDTALTASEMAEAFGRDKLAIVAVDDPGFVKGIKKLIDAPPKEG